MVITGDAINRHEKTVVLLNHRTRLDWLYFYLVVFHSLILNRTKITLKSMLKWLPGLGMPFYFYNFRCTFIIYNFRCIFEILCITRLGNSSSGLYFFGSQLGDRSRAH